MTITLNGSRHEIADGTTVEQLCSVFSVPERGIAVAMNSEVIPRSGWASTRVLPDAKVEIITAAQGG